MVNNRGAGLANLGRYVGPIEQAPDKGTSFKNQLEEIVTVAGWRPEKGHGQALLNPEVIQLGQLLSSLSAQGLGFPLGRVRFTGNRVLWKDPARPALEQVPKGTRQVILLTEVYRCIGLLSIYETFMVEFNM